MTLQQRDKRALLLLGGALAVAGIVFLSTAPPSQPKTVARTETVESAELSLANLRRQVSTGPAKQVVLKRVEQDVAAREKGLFQAETAAQAQAQVLEVIKRLARNANPPVEFSQTELGQPAPFGAYGLVTVAVSFNCRIEQLVNMLADLTAAPELIATQQLRVSAANPKDKTMNVRLEVAGVVPRKLVPARKEARAF